MSDRFIRLEHSNSAHMYDNGYMLKGNLVKYRFCNQTILSYGLDRDDNEWRYGIISHVHRMSFLRNSLQIKFDENGISERMDCIYDLILFPSCPEFRIETISLESHEIYLAKV